MMPRSAGCSKAVRKGDGGLRSGSHLDVKLEYLSFQAPRGANRPIRRIVRGPGVAKTSSESWADLETPVSRLPCYGSKSCDVLVKERDNRAFAVMVQGSLAILVESLPVFPDRCGSGLDHVKPRWETGLQQ